MASRTSRLLLKCGKEQLRRFGTQKRPTHRLTGASTSAVTPAPPARNVRVATHSRDHRFPAPLDNTICQSSETPPIQTRRSVSTFHPEVIDDQEAELTPEIKPFSEIPGPPVVPILGGMINKLPGGIFYKKSNTEASAIMYDLYGPVVKETHPGNFTVIHVFHPEDIETVFRNDGKAPSRVAFFMLKRYNDKYNNQVQGLLTSHGDSWKRLRSNVQQKMLRPKAVSAYLEEQSRVGEDLLVRIEQLREEDGQVEDMRDILYRYATECIGVVCFNTRLGALRNPSANSETARFIKAVNTVMDASHKEFNHLPLYMLIETPLFKSLCQGQKVIREMAEKYSDLAVQKRLESQEVIEGEEGDLIPYLLTKSQLSREDVLTVISEFIFAGVDTTAHFLSFTLLLLAKHPDVQKKLRAEIDDVVPDSAAVTSSDLSRLSYLKAVLKESLRCKPVAPGNCRTTSKDMVLGGYQVPSGSFVALQTEWLSAQERFFPRASEFIPERWLREGGWPACHPFANLPFGMGPRSCIGKRFAEQEVSLAVVKILKKYAVEYPHGDPKIERSITNTPVSPLQFRFIERHAH